LSRARIAVVMLAALALAGCAKHEAGGAMAPMAADAAGAPQGAFLAYEHDVEIALAAEELPARLARVQQACQAGKHGQCEVLHVGQSGGDHPSAQLTVRIVPAGVEPMIADASEAGTVGSRSTHAEDLAQSVQDTAQTQDRLRREQGRLQEFQQRRDLSVADMIALSQQLAQVEAQLQSLDQEAAQQQRRIQTQKLTLRFQPPGTQSGRGEIREAMRDFLATLATGTAWTIRAVAFLIPVVLLFVIAVALWRRVRRRRS